MSYFKMSLMTPNVEAGKNRVLKYLLNTISEFYNQETVYNGYSSSNGLDNSISGSTLKIDNDLVDNVEDKTINMSDNTDYDIVNKRNLIIKLNSKNKQILFPKNSFCYSYNETLSLHTNAQKELKFNMDKKIYYDNNLIDNPYINHLHIGNQILLEDKYGNQFSFTIKNIDYTFKENNISYSYTCEDSFSYQMTRQNDGYSIENDPSSEDFIGAKTIDWWVVKKIQPECHLSYSYIPLEGSLILASDNNTNKDFIYLGSKENLYNKKIKKYIKQGFNKQQYPDFYTTISYSGSGNANSVLIDLASKLGFMINTFEYVDENGYFYRYFWFEPEKHLEVSGLKYSPYSSIQNFNLSHAGDSLTTILNVNSSMQNDELVSLIPNISPFFYKFLNSNEWENSIYYKGYYRDVATHKTFVSSTKINNFDFNIDANSILYQDGYIFIKVLGLSPNTLYNYISFNYNNNASYIVINSNAYYSNIYHWRLASAEQSENSTILNNIVFYDENNDINNLDFNSDIFIAINEPTSLSSQELNVGQYHILLSYFREADDDDYNFADIADEIPWLENKIIDFKYFYDHNIINKVEYQNLTNTINDDLRKVNGKLLYWSSQYYASLHNKTEAIARITNLIDNVSANFNADLVEVYRQKGIVSSISNFEKAYTNLLFEFKPTKNVILNYNEVVTEYFNKYINSQQRYLKNMYNFIEYFNAPVSFAGNGLAEKKYCIKIKDVEKIDNRDNDSAEYAVSFAKTNAFYSPISSSFSDINDLYDNNPSSETYGKFFIDLYENEKSVDNFIYNKINIADNTNFKNLHKANNIQKVSMEKSDGTYINNVEYFLELQQQQNITSSEFEVSISNDYTEVRKIKLLVNKNNSTIESYTLYNNDNKEIIDDNIYFNYSGDNITILLKMSWSNICNRYIKNYLNSGFYIRNTKEVYTTAAKNLQNAREQAEANYTLKSITYLDGLSESSYSSDELNAVYTNKFNTESKKDEIWSKLLPISDLYIEDYQYKVDLKGSYIAYTDKEKVQYSIPMVNYNNEKSYYRRIISDKSVNTAKAIAATTAAITGSTVALILGSFSIGLGAVGTALAANAVANLSWKWSISAWKNIKPSFGTEGLNLHDFFGTAYDDNGVYGYRDSERINYAISDSSYNNVIERNSNSYNYYNFYSQIALTPQIASSQKFQTNKGEYDNLLTFKDSWYKILKPNNNVNNIDKYRLAVLETILINDSTNTIETSYNYFNEDKDEDAIKTIIQYDDNSQRISSILNPILLEHSIAVDFSNLSKDFMTTKEALAEKGLFLVTKDFYDKNKNAFKDQQLNYTDSSFGDTDNNSIILHVAITIKNNEGNDCIIGFEKVLLMHEEFYFKENISKAEDIDRYIESGIYDSNSDLRLNFYNVKDITKDLYLYSIIDNSLTPVSSDEEFNPKNHYYLYNQNINGYERYYTYKQIEDILKTKTLYYNSADTMYVDRISNVVNDTFNVSLYLHKKNIQKYKQLFYSIKDIDSLDDKIYTLNRKYKIEYVDKETEEKTYETNWVLKNIIYNKDSNSGKYQIDYYFENFSNESENLYNNINYTVIIFGSEVKATDTFNTKYLSTVSYENISELNEEYILEYIGNNKNQTLDIFAAENIRLTYSIEKTKEEDISSTTNGQFWYKYKQALDHPILYQNAAAIEVKLQEYWSNAYNASLNCEFFIPSSWAPYENAEINYFANDLFIVQGENNDIISLNPKIFPIIKKLRVNNTTNLPKYQLYYKKNYQNQSTNDRIVDEENRISAAVAFKDNRVMKQLFDNFNFNMSDWSAECVSYNDINTQTYYEVISGGITKQQAINEFYTYSENFNYFSGWYNMFLNILLEHYTNDSVSEYERYKNQHNKIWDQLYFNYPNLFLEENYTNNDATSSKELLVLAQNAFKDKSAPENSYNITLIDIASIQGYKGQELKIGDSIELLASEFYDEYGDIKNSLLQYLFITDINYTLRKDSDISLTVNNIKYQDKLIQRLVKLIK